MSDSVKSRGGFRALMAMALLVGLYGVWEVLSFCGAPYLGLYGTITTVGYRIDGLSGVAREWPLAPGSHITGVENRSVEDWVRALVRVPATVAPPWSVGKAARLLVTERGSSRHMEVVPRVPTLADTVQGPLWRWALASLILPCGVYLLLRNPGQPRVRILSVILFASALSMYNYSGFHLTMQLSPRLPLMLGVSYGALCMIFSSWLYLVVIFLATRGHLRLRRWIPWVLYGAPPAAALAAMAAGWGRPLLAVEAAYRVLYLIAGLVVVFGVGILGRAYRTTRDAVLKAQLKWLLWGHALGMSPYILLYGLPKALTGEPILSYGLSVAPLPLILFAYLFAFYRYRLWDVDTIVHGSLVYGVSVVLLVGAYLVSLGALHQMTRVSGGATSPADFLFLLGAALLFNPLKNVVQGLMDRAWFPEKRGFPSLLMEGSTRLSRSSRIEELQSVLLKDVPAQLSVDCSALALRSQLGAGWELKGRPEDWICGTVDVLAWLDEMAAGPPQPFWHLHPELDALDGGPVQPPLPISVEATVFPLKSGEELWGFYFLGETATRRLLRTEEIQLVQTLCTQAAHMVGNVRLLEGLQRTNRDLAELSHRLIQARKMADLGEGAAILAHELKTPLGIVRGSAEILRKAVEPAEREEVSRFIMEEVDRLSGTVDEFLQFARMSPPSKAEADVNDLVQSAAFLWESRRRSPAHISVRFSLDPALPKAWLDPKQVYQALLNLFTNAEDAMPEGGDLIISTARGEDSGASVRIAVSDTGKGVSPDSLPRVFERFYTTKDGGLGLGLAVVRKIMDAHGGEVRMASRPDHGTEVALRFPGRAETSCAHSDSKAQGNP
jgi:signal transduction histidine kinase